MKSFHDAEARVVAPLPGTGKHKGRLGALRVELKDGTAFSVGTGFSDREREKPPAIGAVITFRYQELTDAGVPRLPSFVGERTDLVDFGQYQFEPRFDLPLLSLVHDHFLQWGGAMWPNQPNWIQPDPQLAVNREVVAHRPIGATIARLAGKDPDHEISGDRYFGFQMVQRLEESGLDPSDVEDAMQRFIADATASWHGEAT